jgi:excisionase family DNA binding protein
MHDSFTPRQVARALGIGESTVKRWCDKGVIPVDNTPGGHRRIPLAPLFEFLKTSGRTLTRPELLGLPANVGKGERVLERAAIQLAGALLAGDEEQSRHIVYDLYLAEHDMGVLCDRVLARAFELIGRRWECGEVEVFQERLGCRIAERLIDGLRLLVRTPAADAPRALGGSPPGDQYDLPTQMAELVLRDAGWNAVSLGNNLPFDSLAQAIRSRRPQLAWLSCSHLPDEAEFLREYRRFYDELGAEVAVVVGGRALHEALRKEMKYAAFCDGMQHLTAFAQTLSRR